MLILQADTETRSSHHVCMHERNTVHTDGTTPSISPFQSHNAAALSSSVHFSRKLNPRMD